MIEYRPQNESDRNFLYTLFASTREQEMRMTGWDNMQIKSFLQFQFNTQLNQYLNNYKNASFEIITIHGIDAGRLYVNELDHGIQIIDISLLPEYRGNGHGRKILNELITKGNRSRKTIFLSVIFNNPAKNLYQRLGFVEVSENPPYIQMEKNPDT